MSSEIRLEREMGDPRPHSRIDENARSERGGGNGRAMAMATRARTVARTDGERRSFSEGGCWRGR